MKWIVVKGTHINTHQLETFFWRGGMLWLCFAGDPTPTTWNDPDRELYIKMCHALGVRPYGEDDEDGKN